MQNTFFDQRYLPTALHIITVRFFQRPFDSTNKIEFSNTSSWSEIMTHGRDGRFNIF